MMSDLSQRVQRVGNAFDEETEGMTKSKYVEFLDLMLAEVEG